MKISFHNRKFENILALTAFLMAVFAALIGEPYRMVEEREEILKPVEIEGMKITYVTSLQLAEWIMEKRGDLLLIDIRPSTEFNSYHIPSAQPLSSLTNNQEDTSQVQTIIIYAGDNESALESWLELKQWGHNEVYLLEGGIRAWAREILFPDLSNAFGLKKSMIEKKKRISLYFGGKPKLGEFQSGKTGKRYYREGC